MRNRTDADAARIYDSSCMATDGMVFREDYWRHKMSLGMILLIVLVLALVGVIPAWGHSASWGYGPSGGIGLVLLIVVILLLMGKI